MAKKKQTSINYIKLNQHLRLELNQISDELNKKRFIREFKNSKDDEINFKSTISEFRFAQFLEKETLAYEYNPKIDIKTPDFKFKSDREILYYFDVKRFNIPDFSVRDNNKIAELVQKIETINKPYEIYVDPIKKGDHVNLDLIFNKIKNWILKEKRKEGDILKYDIYEIEIVKTNGFNSHIICNSSEKNPEINNKKITSIIIDKINSYQKSIIEKGIPFFVGLHLTFETSIRPIDYYLEFLGSYSMNSKTRITDRFQLGEFYINPKFSQIIGLLILFDKQFYWVKNPRNRTQNLFKNVKKPSSLI